MGSLLGSFQSNKMNFSPFGTHFSSSIPTIHQFAAKFSQDSPVNNMLCPPPDTNSSRYTANGVPSFTQHHPATPAQQQLAVNNTKYQANYMNQNMVYGGQNNLRQLDKRYEQHQQDVTTTIATDKQHKSESPPHHHIHNNGNNGNQTQPPPPPPQLPSAWQSLAATSGSTVADYLSHLPASTLPISLHHFLKYSAESIKKENTQTVGGGGGGGNQGNDLNYIIGGNAGHNGANGILNNTNNHLLNNPNNLSSLTTINTSHLQSNSTNNSPISVINTPVVPITGVNNNNNNAGGALATTTSTTTTSTSTTKKRKKKKVEKEKKPKPRPGEIRLTTALDGSTLYCCPECHMAYPEKELLEQHLVGHTLERRFVCDICGAGLKRKDHLTRHKQSHNPERPYVCTVCLKAFKRKEQLTLHFVIHSGEKRHVCSECGKGFYRKDHLRKHTRSHIARRVKAELSQHGAGNGSSGNGVTTPGNTLHLQLASPTSHSVVATNIMS